MLKSMMPAMDTFELSKLPALAEHYAEHQKENPGISLWEFIVLHYENNRHHKEDHDKHSNLPYGAQHHDSSPLQVWFSCTNFNVQFCNTLLRTDPASTYISPFESLWQSSIWQPPRNA